MLAHNCRVCESWLQQANSDMASIKWVIKDMAESPKMDSIFNQQDGIEQ